MKQERRKIQFKDALSGGPPLWVPNPVGPSNLLYEMHPETIFLKEREKHWIISSVSHWLKVALQGINFPQPTPGCSCLNVKCLLGACLGKESEKPWSQKWEAFMSGQRQGLARWCLTLKLFEAYSVTQVWLAGRRNQRIWSGTQGMFNIPYTGPATLITKVLRTVVTSRKLFVCFIQLLFFNSLT